MSESMGAFEALRRIAVALEELVKILKEARATK
jgi:hypothetical protein